jgi:D-alanine-D-alanine ligase
MSERRATMRRADHVVVISGGLSFEREVSLSSGQQVANALGDAGLDVTMMDADQDLLQRLLDLGPNTVAFMALHGAIGEDGTLQDILDACGVRYVGSRGEASRLAYDKPIAKHLASHRGIATPNYASLAEETFHDLGASFILDRFDEHLGFPLVVKPTRGGSSFGLSVVRNRQDLPQAMINCFNHGRTALLEAYVEGTEVAVGLVESTDGLLVLPPVEIVPDSGIYDFEARYTPGRTRYFAPARLPSETLTAVSAAAQDMHYALGLRHISRCDFIVDNNGTPQFLEATGSPGLTDTSIILVAMRELGLTTSQIFADLVGVALQDPRNVQDVIT